MGGGAWGGGGVVMGCECSGMSSRGSTGVIPSIVRDREITFRFRVSYVLHARKCINTFCLGCSLNLFLGIKTTCFNIGTFFYLYHIAYI